MKFSKKASIAAVLFVIMMVFVGCSSNDEGDSAADNAKSPDQVGSVSLENPIVVDKEAGTVTVLSQVNGKYFTEATRHASVFKEGSNGAKSVFTSYGNHEDFYNGLVEIGAEPGNNMTPDNAATTTC